MLLPIYLQIASSIAAASICSTIEMDIDWTHKIVKDLRAGELPGDEKQAHKIRVQAIRFTLIEDSLYRRSFGGS